MSILSLTCINILELNKIDGKTFNTGLNTLALLEDSELQQMFGLVPDMSSFQVCFSLFVCVFVLKFVYVPRYVIF